MQRTPGNRASWLALGALAGCALLQPLACRPDPGSNSTPAEEAQVDALAQVGPGVVLPALEGFAVEADALEAALEALVDAPEDAGAKATAQAAWASAFLVWQEVELLQLGPAASSLTAAGGEDRRDELYSWPTVNPCRVDQETVEGEWGTADWYAENLVNVYGLDAIEYLLWAPEGNDCPGQVPINAEGSWDALGPSGVAQRRADYALALAQHVTDQADALITAWSPDGGDFSGAMTREDGAPYGSALEALNAVYDALFYLETETKDRKLAVPLGLKPCGSEDCTATIEAPHSGLGGPAIAANLRGFRALFTGNDGDGMDDLLVELGEQELVDQVLADTDAAIALADGLTVPLDEAVVDRPEEVEALHAAVKRVGDALKGDIATILTLTVPAEAAGDND